MGHLNIEIKARCTNAEKIRNTLKNLNATYGGKDHQIDTYFNVERGRLKLREGDIENFLIHYQREDERGPKESQVFLARTSRGDGVKDVLSACLGIFVTVEKTREIFFIDNVKFHLDEVQELGSFVEIEARGSLDATDKNVLAAQCSHYRELFEIAEEDLLSRSYSDLVSL